MNKEIRFELDKKTWQWFNKKHDLIDAGDKLKTFLSYLVGMKFTFKKQQYKIVEIIWDESNSFNGGNIHCKCQRGSLISKLFFPIDYFFTFEEFYHNLDSEKIKFEDQ
jgi:hypothetical protein